MGHIQGLSEEWLWQWYHQQHWRRSQEDSHERLHCPLPRTKLFFLGLFFIAVNIPLSFALILGAERVIGWLKARPGILRAIDFAFAGVFGFFAFKILTTQGR